VWEFELNESEGYPTPSPTPGTPASGEARSESRFSAKQVPRARYARRRGKASRGRHLFASDEELVAGLDV
jgi:hypothetical protein